MERIANAFDWTLLLVGLVCWFIIALVLSVVVGRVLSWSWHPDGGDEDERIGTKDLRN